MKNKIETLNDYQQRILKFLSPKTTETKESQLENSIFGLNGESGEVADLWKKHRWHNHPFDSVKMALELGDVLFYVAEAADALGFTLSEIAEMNIYDKLEVRYPKGHFTTEDSIDKADQK